ncbi:MAG: leucine-rich repeat domain-containing protein [Cyanobacteria bacterium J06559_3]
MTPKQLQLWGDRTLAVPNSKSGETRMKQAIALGLLSLLAVVIVSCTNLAVQNEPLSDSEDLFTTIYRPTFETFVDWCHYRGNLDREARRTVKILLKKADTQSCDQAEAWLTNLTHLDLSREVQVFGVFGNPIVDVTPLKTLTNLTRLTLYGNQIADVTPLKHLAHLTYLDLSRNQIVDIAPLASLRNLTELDLGTNRIADVTPLASLSNLERLKLGSNPLRDRTCPVQPETICQF